MTVITPHFTALNALLWRYNALSYDIFSLDSITDIISERWILVASYVGLRVAGGLQ